MKELKEKLKRLKEKYEDLLSEDRQMLQFYLSSGNDDMVNNIYAEIKVYERIIVELKEILL